MSRKNQENVDVNRSGDGKELEDSEGYFSLVGQLEEVRANIVKTTGVQEETKSPGRLSFRISVDRLAFFSFLENAFVSPLLLCIEDLRTIQVY
ncbi:hypothetical protein R1flu_022871 [Riccia fluitans]|uniref:Uncharacterized protein n=1 Tax=Riccia fluitans TaxID=41844 RepID=A0ABD1XQG7_9MARC